MLQPGQLVVLESTTYPGTTRERLAPILEESGLPAGTRLPPRLLARADRPRPHRLHGAHHAEAGRRPHRRPAPSAPARSTRRSATTVVVLSSPETAELSKLLENIFRSVNIALVNELAQLCDRLEIDVWEVIDAASTKPFGFMRFDPGPGMGGHCLPVDPFYLAFKAREHDFYPEFIELAGKVNQAQPAFCVERIERALNQAGKPVNGSKILILGAAYKGGVGDTRESPALKIIETAAATSAPTSPTTTPTSPSCASLGLRSVDLDAALAEADVVAIVTAHPEIDYADVVATGAAGRRLPRRHPRHRRRQPGPAVATRPDGRPRQCTLRRRARSSCRSTTWAISFTTLESPVALMWPVSTARGSCARVPFSASWLNCGRSISTSTRSSWARSLLIFGPGSSTR